MEKRSFRTLARLQRDEDSFDPGATVTAPTADIWEDFSFLGERVRITDLFDQADVRARLE